MNSTGPREVPSRREGILRRIQWLEERIGVVKDQMRLAGTVGVRDRFARDAQNLRQWVNRLRRELNLSAAEAMDTHSRSIDDPGRQEARRALVAQREGLKRTLRGCEDPKRCRTIEHQLRSLAAELVELDATPKGGPHAGTGS